jgi:hypothetical protein
MSPSDEHEEGVAENPSLIDAVRDLRRQYDLEMDRRAKDIWRRIAEREVHNLEEDENFGDC